MYPAIDEQDLSFHLVHEKDSSPIGYQKICKAEGKPVPDDEIVKAYELSDGKYVEMADEDFEAAEESGYHTLTLLDFVPYEQIDPIFFERTYYLGPDEGAERAYVLLVKALEESGLAAVARYVFRNRQQLGCVRVRDGVLTLEKMYLADEIRPHEGDRADGRQGRETGVGDGARPDRSPCRRLRPGEVRGRLPQEAPRGDPSQGSWQGDPGGAVRRAGASCRPDGGSAPEPRRAPAGAAAARTLARTAGGPGVARRRASTDGDSSAGQPSLRPLVGKQLAYDGKIRDEGLAGRRPRVVAGPEHRRGMGGDENRGVELPREQTAP